MAGGEEGTGGPERRVEGKIWDSRITYKEAKRQRNSEAAGTKCSYENSLLQVISGAPTAERTERLTGGAVF